MRVCFLHVPKTAGTSVINLMFARFGKANVFQITDSRFYTFPVARILAAHPIVAGHLIARHLSNDVLEDAFVFTFLRDPLERALSQYSYYRSLPAGNFDRNARYAQEFDLKELLRKQTAPGRFSPWANWQTQIFCGGDSQRPANGEALVRAKHNLEQFSFVGVQEELVAGTQVLAQAWGGEAPVEVPMMNQTEERLSLAALDDETRELLEQNHVLDRELYLHAKQLWEKRHRRAEPPNLITDLGGEFENRTREIEIVSVVIEGDRENHARLIPGSRWALLLDLRSRVVEDDLTIGIKITDAVGLEIYGTNTSLQGQKMEIREGEFVSRIEFPNLSLSPGFYSLTVAVHTGATAEVKCFHWLADAFRFEVISSKQRNFVGLVDLGAEFFPPERLGVN